MGNDDGLSSLCIDVLDKSCCQWYGTPPTHQTRKPGPPVPRFRQSRDPGQLSVQSWSELSRGQPSQMMP